LPDGIMHTPELKQFGDLVEADFRRHPVWIQCHIVDYDEPWHDETDDLGSMQPHLFVGGTLFGFWGGGFGVSQETP
jgi:hypothetical protein